MSGVEYYYRENRHEVVFPATGATDDLTDPVTGRTLSPVWVRLELVHKETPDEGERRWAHVSVHGPRRLKSGQLGREISSFGWGSALHPGDPHGLCERPEWLTGLLAEHLPDEWHPSLLELPTGGAM